MSGKPKATMKDGKWFWVATDDNNDPQTTWSRCKMSSRGGYFLRVEDEPGDVPDRSEMDSMLEEFGVKPPRGTQIQVRLQVRRGA